MHTHAHIQTWRMTGSLSSVSTAADEMRAMERVAGLSDSMDPSRRGAWACWAA